MVNNGTFASKEERQRFRGIYTLIGRFRDLDGEMTVHQMLSLLWVALNEGRTQRDLRAALDLPSSTASRNLAALSKVHRLGKEGLGLIEWVEDPEDRRAKLIYLSPKGRAFVNQILGDL